MAVSKMRFSIVAILTLHVIAKERLVTNEQANNEATVTLHSSCNYIEQNGLYYIKPTEDGPVLPVICSDTYTMIDGSLDPNLESIPAYLSSWEHARGYTTYIVSQLDDLSPWRDWWTLATPRTSFRVANQCLMCESSGTYGDDVVYYTDGLLFCFNQMSGAPCQSTVNEYACNQCDQGRFDENMDWTRCTALHMPSNATVNHEQAQRVAHGLVFRPVISLMPMVRTACTCYKPADDEVTQYVVDITELPSLTLTDDMRQRIGYIDSTIIIASESMEYDTDACDQNVVYLTNSDFDEGTLRIVECGEYILSEDIVFNFNPPTSEEMNSDGFSPNSIDLDELYWFPRRDQQSADEYPGTYTYSGAFALGYFAGITIETDNVTIDLNGYSLS
eukprot:475219_1